MIRVVVDNRIRLPADELGEAVVKELRRLFTHDNPEYRRQELAGRRDHGEPREYRTYGSSGLTELTLPRGGMRRLREVLHGAGIPWTVEDRREGGDKRRKQKWLDLEYYIPDHNISLYPYQQDAVSAMLKKEQGLLRAPTGSGKTACGLAIAARLKIPTLVMVWSGNLMDQWVQRCESELGLTSVEVGVFGGGMRKFAPITVAMQQSVHLAMREGGKEAESLTKFGCVIADEVQRAAAITMYAAINPLPARYRFGISADHTRKDGKEFLTHDLFGDVVADIPREQLVASGHVLDVEVRAVPTSFRADWYKYRQDFNRLLAQMAESEPRNRVALDLAKAEVDAGEQVLLFSHRVEHCRVLASALVARGVPTGVMTGGKSCEQEFLKTREALVSGRLRAAVGTVAAIGQGLDLPSVSRGILVTPIASNRQQFNQVRGRICRTAEGKNGARLYVLHDAVYGRRHLQNLRKWNATVLVLSCERWVPVDEYLSSSIRTSSRGKPDAISDALFGRGRV